MKYKNKKSVNYYGAVYRITDTNKDGYWDRQMVYIGQTIQLLKNRFYVDLNYPHNKYLENAVNRYNKRFKIISIDSEHAQTKGGEFKMEVIKKCHTLRELNQEEITQIKYHKSHIPTYHKYIAGNIIPLYGYNLSKGGGARPYFTGVLHPLYVHINKRLLEDLVNKGYLNYEIAREFNLTRDIINDKIRDLYPNLNSLYDLRVHINAVKQYRERKISVSNESFHMNRIKENYTAIDKVLLEGLLKEDLSSLEIDEIFLKKLVFLGFSKQRICKKIKLGDHACIERIQEIFNFNNFTEFRDMYFLKPRIITILKASIISYNNITQKINTGYKSIKPLNKTSRAGVKASIKRIWNNEFSFYFELFSKHKTRASYEFLKYLNRRFYVYPRINDEFNTILLDSEKNPDEIDCEMLELLIYEGKNIQKISDILRMPYKWTSKWSLRILGMDYTTARDKFYWKAKLYKIIEDHPNIPSCRDIANNLNIAQSNLNSLLNRVFCEELKELGNIDNLIKSIKKSSSPKFRMDPLIFLKEKYIIFFKRKYSVSEISDFLTISRSKIRNDLKEGWNDLYKHSNKDFKNFLCILYEKYSKLPENSRFYNILRNILPSIYQLILNRSKNEFNTRLLSNITPFDRTTLNDYMREIFLPKNIVKIKTLSYNKFPTVYKLTNYGFSLIQSDEIFV